MKIAIVSLFTEEIQDLVVHTSSNQKKYAEKHGYDYILFKGRFSNRFPAWDKIKAVEKILPDYDYVMWIDSDCVFKNFDFKLESLISPDYKGFFGKDPVDTIYVNTGVFMLKNDPWSFELLEYVWNKNGKIYMKVDKYSYNDWPFEQGPIIDFLNNDKGNHYIVPDYAMNCHPYFVSDKTFIIHYMGCRKDEKTFKDTLSKIVKLNNQNNISPELQNFISVDTHQTDKEIKIVAERKFKVIYDNIVAELHFVLKNDNSLCFYYDLPKNQNLSHVFKINNNDIFFNSDSFGCFEVPNEFYLYHSYEWYGKTDFKYIGHFKINE